MATIRSISSVVISPASTKRGDGCSSGKATADTPLTSSLVEVDLRLLADDVGDAASDTGDGRQGVHNLQATGSKI
jgi:hypothetical protein